ncbi:hypothetical protein [Hahella sp. NBU794]|uniref:hypothetical protein n=1 Tax=Hahella sp. NBU794 TaxID=3422590 RepID=UPI003D6E8694
MIFSQQLQAGAGSALVFFERYGVEALIILGALGAAVVFGVVASTGNLLLAGLAAGMIVGLLAFANAAITLWLILFLGLFVAGLAPIWAEGLSKKAVWGISVLGLILFLSAASRRLLNPASAEKQPLFIWLALVFVGYALLNGAAQSTLFELASGFKRYFQVMGVCFALAWLSFSRADMDRWVRLFAALVIVQLPFALYELLKLVPVRESLQYAYPGMIPIDVVAGTFGATRYAGGANAEMASFLVIALGFLLARRSEKLITPRHFAVLGLFALTPLFLGETKVVVIFLPVMFVTLYGRELLRKPHLAVLALIVGALLTLGAAYAYLQLVKAQSLSEMLSDTMAYNMGDKGYGGYYLNRLTGLLFWFHQQGLHDPVSFFFGCGIGSAHDATGGTIALRYPGFGVSLTALSSLLWEQGLLGSLLFYGVLVSAWLTAGRLRAARFGRRIMADAAGIQAALSLCMIYPVYRSTLLEGLPFQILFWGMLGYLAWLYRESRHAEAAA